MLVFHYSPFLLHSTTTSLYTDCSNNLYAGSPSYLLILFSALSAFAVGGLSIERNQKPLAPEITLAVTHHDRQKQVEVKRSSRVNPHEIRLFSGCPYYFTLPMDGNNNSFPKHLRQPCKERRAFGVDVHHIVSSECTIKCRKCGGADCSKSTPLNGRNRLLTDSLVLRFTSIVIFCTTHMMACSVVAGHVTTILCHSGAELFDNDLYSAFSR